MPAGAQRVGAANRYGCHPSPVTAVGARSSDGTRAPTPSPHRSEAFEADTSPSQRHWDGRSDGSCGSRGEGPWRQFRYLTVGMGKTGGKSHRKSSRFSTGPTKTQSYLHRIKRNRPTPWKPTLRSKKPHFTKQPEKREQEWCHSQAGKWRCNTRDY